MVMRGKTLAGLASFLLVFLMAPAPVRPAARQEVVYSGLGGSGEEDARLVYGPTFERETGIKVIFVAKGASLDVLAAIRAQRDRPTVDVVEIDEPAVLEGRKLGLWARLDPKLVPNLAKIYSSGRVANDEAVIGWVFALGIAYNTEIFKKNGWAPPTSWMDVLRPELGKHVVLPAMDTSFGPLMVLRFAQLNGGSIDNIQPGYEVMRRLKPNILTWEKTFSRIGELFQSGDAYMTVWSNLGTFILKEAGVPIQFVLPRDKAFSFGSALAVVKNSPNPEGAQRFVNYLLSERAQAYKAGKRNYGPMNREVKLNPSVAARVVYGPAGQEGLVRIDWDKFIVRRYDWADWVTREIISK